VFRKTIVGSSRTVRCAKVCLRPPVRGGQPSATQGYQATASHQRTGPGGGDDAMRRQEQKGRASKSPWTPRASPTV